MCEIIEKLQEDSAAEAKLKNSIEIALNLLKAGQSVTFTATMTKLAIDFVKQLAIDNDIAYTM